MVSKSSYLAGTDLAGMKKYTMAILLLKLSRCMSERSWDPEENGKPKEYMAGFQSRYFGERIPLFHDEESFLQLLIKDDRMKIYKWEWEPEN